MTCVAVAYKRATFTNKFANTLVYLIRSTVYVQYFTKAIIELVKVNMFLIYKSTLTVKFNAT